MIVKLAKDGYSSSQIGIKLRDEYSIPLVKPILEKSVAEVLKENKIQPPVPEEIDRLLRRAKRLQDHLNQNKGDRKNVRSLELLEAKIHRRAKYYKEKQVIPQDWKYQTVVAQLA
jgi:small subunit ribosomal protein S15